MIPKDYIAEWRSVAPWTTDAQVEQDLVLSRVLTVLFTDNDIAAELAFRGGIALYKLHIRRAARYSSGAP